MLTAPTSRCLGRCTLRNVPGVVVRSYCIYVALRCVMIVDPRRGGRCAASTSRPQIRLRKQKMKNKPKRRAQKRGERSKSLDDDGVFGRRPNRRGRAPEHLPGGGQAAGGGEAERE